MHVGILHVINIRHFDLPYLIHSLRLGPASLSRGPPRRRQTLADTRFSPPSPHLSVVSCRANPCCSQGGRWRGSLRSLRFERLRWAGEMWLGATVRVGEVRRVEGRGVWRPATHHQRRELLSPAVLGTPIIFLLSPCLVLDRKSVV